MKSGGFNRDLGLRLKSEKAVLKPRGRTFRLLAIAVIAAAVIVGINVW